MAELKNDVAVGDSLAFRRSCFVTTSPPCASERNASMSCSGEEESSVIVTCDRQEAN